MTTEILILQAAANPHTGVWALMRSLTGWLKSQSGIDVAIGVLAKSSWPQAYLRDIKNLDVPFFKDNIYDFPGSYLLNFFSASFNNWLKVLHDQFKPKFMVIHFHDAWVSGLYLPVRPKLDCPFAVVDTFHGVWPYENKAKIKKYLHKIIAQRLMTYKATLTSTDRQGIMQAHENYGLPQAGFHHIPNGLDDNGLRGCPHLNDPNRALTVGFVGSFDSNKGWRLVAAAVNQLYAQGKNLQLVLAGSGPENHEAAEWASNHAHFVSFKGFVKDAGITLIPHLDVLVLPSKQEGMPMAIMEAISCGVPVVATPINAIPDMVIDGYNGFLVSRDAAEIAGALAKLVDDTNLHREMSANAVKHFREHFEISRIGQQFLDLYQGLAAGSG
jgi:glycosyltransferase involved in cell wall biosynthesis